MKGSLFEKFSSPHPENVAGGLAGVFDFGASNMAANGSGVVNFYPPPRFTKVNGSTGFGAGCFN